jgi:hypothetical protein
MKRKVFVFLFLAFFSPVTLLSGSLLASDGSIAFPSFIASARRSLVIIPQGNHAFNAMEVYILTSKSAFQALGEKNALSFPLPPKAKDLRLVHGFNGTEKIGQDSIVYSGKLNLGQNQFGLTYGITMDPTPYRFEPGRIASPHIIELFVPKGAFPIKVEGSEKLKDEALPTETAPQVFEHYVGHAGLPGAPNLVVLFEVQEGAFIHPAWVIAGGLGISLLLLLGYKALSKRRGRLNAIS